VRLSWGLGVPNVMGYRSSEYDEIQQRVGSESVGSVYGYTGGFSSGVQSLDNLVLAVLDGDDLTSVLGWDT